MIMKIAFFEVEGWEENIVKDALAPNLPNGLRGHEILFVSQKTQDADSNAKDAELISIFVDSKADAETLGHFPNLKFIATRSTGFDHINLNFCKERGILVSNVPGYGDNTVAEFAFGLILSLTRKIYKAIDQIKETENFSLRGLRGTDLKGKVIGIIGTGRIGKEAIRIAKGFGMKVIAYDMKPDIEFSDTLKFPYVPLNVLLSESDIVSVHCPLNDSTFHLINNANVRLMKRGSYLINTARGGIVDTEALLSALKGGILAGAGIDVLEEEGDIKDEMRFLSDKKSEAGKLRTMLQEHALMNMENVLVTPHNAFNSQEALERILNTTLRNISSYISGSPQNIVS